MKSSYQQICTLLAASGFRDRDIADFTQTLFEVGPQAFAQDVLSLRHAIPEMGRDIPYDTPSRIQAEPSSEISERIERLLILEAGLPKAAAIEVLSSELKERYPNNIIPSESRKGFHAWIHRLTNAIPEKQLLHLATSIRNRYVRERPSDWRLK